MNDKDFDFETRRKIFHLYSLILPLLYLYIITSKINMSVFLLLLTGITLHLDISRHYNDKIKVLVDNFFGKYIRTSEKSGTLKLTGASYMALGFLLSCLFFSKGLAITSWLILIISDCLAALVGLKFGKQLYNGKSLAGSGAFFTSSVFISILSYFFINYRTSFVIIILACAVATIAEFYSKEIKIDDNLSIPLSYCFITFVLSLAL